MNLEDEFTRALEGTVKASKAKNYTPTFFVRMLQEHGGVETAKRLLASQEPQTGLFELYNLQLLHESMEANVLRKKFRSLFTEKELAEAHRRLEDLGFFQQENEGWV